jgi:hypothetical protein
MFERLTMNTTRYINNTLAVLIFIVQLYLMKSINCKFMKIGALMNQINSQTSKQRQMEGIRVYFLFAMHL